MSILKKVVSLVSVMVWGACYGTAVETATEKPHHVVTASRSAKTENKKDIAVVEHKVDLATAANVLSDIEAGEEIATVADASLGETFHDIAAVEEEALTQKVAYKEKNNVADELDKEVGLPVSPYGDTTTQVAQENFDQFNFDEFARTLEQDFDLLGGDESEESF